MPSNTVTGSYSLSLEGVDTNTACGTLPIHCGDLIAGAIEANG